MRPVTDKQIAAWLGISLPTLYRWIRAGLIPVKPRTEGTAVAMRWLIDEARDQASFIRSHGRVGRTSLPEIVEVLGGSK